MTAVEAQAVLPSSRYRRSFLEALEGYRAADERVYASLYAPAGKDWDGYLRSMAREEEGRELPDGFVPCSHRWLVTPEDEVVGVVRIRHRLSWMNELVGGHIGYDVPPRHRRQGYGGQCLARGLDRARAVGLRDVLVTCSPDNVASRRIILQQGGVFEREVHTEDDGAKQRFWIRLGDRAG